MVKLPPMPDRIERLPRDPRGFPVPWFVAWVDGKPLFHVADGKKLAEAVTGRKCWVCGDVLGRNLAFVIGPMCTVNRISAEPPCHLECAEFSAKACPFLSKPKMGRVGETEGVATVDAAGIMLRRNPGVACVWVTREHRIIRVDNGVLFRIGEPIGTHWFAEGRTATRDEVMASIESGLPLLQDAARQDGPDAELELVAMTRHATRYLPA